MKADFATYRKCAPHIHAFGHSGVVILESKPQDEKHDAKPYSQNYTGGVGTMAHPIEYISAADVSPHYAIVDLWFHHRYDEPWICINGWLFRVQRYGVLAQDGAFTKLA